MDEAKLTTGLSRLEQLAHQGGVTTLGDMGTGSSGDIEADVAAIRSNLEKDDLPFRMRLVPDVKTLDLKLSGDEAKSLAAVRSLPAQNSQHLLFGPQVKLYADGAFFAEAMQLDPPGYNDGHEGQWMMPPERLKQLIELYWTNGYDIHIHCNGSLALSTILAKLEELQTATPPQGPAPGDRAFRRFDRRTGRADREARRRRLRQPLLPLHDGRHLCGGEPRQGAGFGNRSPWFAAQEKRPVRLAFRLHDGAD